MHFIICINWTKRTHLGEIVSVRPSVRMFHPETAEQISIKCGNVGVVERI
jgi:hypothetical protein